jgi:hypothetical protein
MMNELTGAACHADRARRHIVSEASHKKSIRNDSNYLAGRADPAITQCHFYSKKVFELFDVFFVLG